MTGTVNWALHDRPFGTILGDDGVQYVAYYTEVTTFPKLLKENQRVEFDVQIIPPNKMMAVRIRPAS